MTNLCNKQNGVYDSFKRANYVCYYAADANVIAPILNNNFLFVSVQ